jgi:hypothetical protein
MIFFRKGKKGVDKKKKRHHVRLGEKDQQCCVPGPAGGTPSTPDRGPGCGSQTGITSVATQNNPST